MKIPHPWKCDSCNAVKQPSNNWLIVEAGSGYAAALASQMNRIVIWEWSDILAEQAGVKHVCGQKCAIDQISKVFHESFGVEKPKVESEREIR